MDPVKAVVTPAKQGDWERRGRVQVTVSSGRPYTCHAQREKKSGRWFAHNPDEAAIARLDVVELTEANAGQAVRAALVGFERAKSAFSALEGKKEDMGHAVWGQARRLAGTVRKLAGDRFAAAEAAAVAAEKAANQARAVTPRMVEFTF